MLLPPDIDRNELLTYVRPPYPNGIFPLGTGWQIMLFVVVAGFLVFFLFYRGSRMKRRREAFFALAMSRRSFLDGGDLSALAGDLSVLMRRVALFRFGRKKTAGLNGREWVDFLNETGAVLNEKDRELLIRQAYAPPFRDQDDSAGKHLLGSVQKWLERNI